ncbi:MAG: PAS domain S-box protein, partial [Desulfobacterales bacterium]|nr:PAS domain S-box protein [Desulfobacterales bacterium]
AIFQDAVEGIYQTTPEGRLISASPSLARMMGYESGEAMVESIGDLARDFYYDPGERKQFLKEIRDQGEVRDFETRFKTKSGTPIWCLVSARAIRGEADKILYYQGFIIDISARKASALELQRLRIHMQNIINGMPSALVGMDLEGRVIHWNHEAELITGITSDAAKGQPLESIFPQIAPGMAQAQKAIMECRIQKDSKVLTYVNGQVRYWDITVYPLIPDRCEGAVIRVDDVTEQIRMEEMMIQSEKMLSLGGLAAGMAHEINNPLSAIIQSSQVIQNRLSSDLPQNNTVAENCGTSLPAINTYMEKREIHDMLTAIGESGKRAAKIIENMLSFARKGDGQISHYDLSDLINRTVNLAKNDYNLKKDYDFRKIDVVREFDPDLPKIPCEASKIQQVLFNILRNGAQAMAAANGSLKDSQHRFIISLTKEDQMARIDIQDNGPGMDKETRRKIFEPFFTTKGRGVGTGLGLSVSYFIITENHKGSISVESAPGRGAKFIIRLPLTREMAN